MVLQISIEDPKKVWQKRLGPLVTDDEPIPRITVLLPTGYNPLGVKVTLDVVQESQKGSLTRGWD
jgi:hypothetical protein